jgi:hypothetical protein
VSGEEISVRFLKQHGAYNAGELATFSVAIAKELLRLGVVTTDPPPQVAVSVPEPPAALTSKEKAAMKRKESRHG